MFGWLTSFRVEAVLFLIALLAVSSVFLLNDVSIHVRMKELKVYLQNLDRVEDNLDQIRLVQAYRLNKQFYNGEISKDRLQMVEYNVTRLLEERPGYKSITSDSYPVLTIPVIAAINGIRRITGRQAIQNIPESRWNESFEIAYYYERNNFFKKAVEYYEKALTSGDLTHPIRASILLHKGFSSAMTGDTEQARAAYGTVLEEYRGEPPAITASLLLRYLDGFQNEIKSILSRKEHSLESAERLNILHAYHDSLKILDQIEKTSKTEDVEKINYYRAHCHEKTGNSEIAASIYLKIIANRPDSTFSKYAARRLYFMSTTGGKNERINRLLKTMSILKQDDILSAMIDFNERIPATRRNAPALHDGKSPDRNETKRRYDNAAVLNVDHILIGSAEEALKKGYTTIPPIHAKKANPLIPDKLRIHMKDGTVFVGSILIKNDGKLTLKTVIGEITVFENKVEKIEKH